MHYLGIYDLRLLPLSLGDMLSWIASQKLFALKSNATGLHVVVIFPSSFVGNLLNEVKTREYWNNHLKELSMLFTSDDFIENYYIFENIDEITRPEVYINGVDAIQQNLNLINNLKNTKLLWSYIHSFQKFDRFNDYHNLNGKKIILNSKIEYIGKAEKILISHGIINPIICQPRFRMIDNGLPPSDPRRDSNFLKWLFFFKDASVSFPSQVFLIIGRRQSIPSELLIFGNVICSRDLGMTLAHEIAMVRNSKFFIGASSGFAIAANFSETPYIIYNLKPAGLKNYGLSGNSNKLVFSNPDQIMLEEDISFNNFDHILRQANNNNPNDTDIDLTIKGQYPSFNQSIITSINNNSKRYIIRLITIDLETSIDRALDGDYSPMNSLLQKINIIWPKCEADPLFRNIYGKRFSIIGIYFLKYWLHFDYVILRLLDYYNVLSKYHNYKLLDRLFLDKLKKYIKLIFG